MAKSYTIISPTQEISAITFKTVRALKSWAKRYIERIACCDELVLVQRKDRSYGFMLYDTPLFRAALADKVIGFWFSHELKYE